MSFQLHRKSDLLDSQAWGRGEVTKERGTYLCRSGMTILSSAGPEIKGIHRWFPKGRKGSKTPTQAYGIGGKTLIISSIFLRLNVETILAFEAIMLLRGWRVGGRNNAIWRQDRTKKRDSQ